MVEDGSCTKLKGYISQLNFLICARTHASIAAYSNQIPTLVVGYSVKSRGIAQDLFGDAHDYVIPVEKLQNNDDLLQKFLWMLQNEKIIKDKLIMKIPEYIQSTRISSDIAKKLLLEDKKRRKDPILLNDKKKCCGCLACVDICSSNAINVVTDKEGFKYPNVNTNACVLCGKCSEVCPFTAARSYKKELPKLEGAYAKDKKIREISSSGGIFYLLGKNFLEKEGIVFGAAWNENNQLVHQRVTEISKLYKLCGSKYVQSDTSNAYRCIKNDLENGKMVYFSGTPCQVKALKLFLGKSYDNLFTQDFICHGVPSPEVLDKYADEVLEGEWVNQIFFRSKKKGWNNFSFEIIGKEHMYHSVFNEDPFFHAFLKDYSLRPSCYECTCKGIFRDSDITLADYWGVDTIQKELFDNKGTSLFFLNSNKGKQIFKEIKGDVIYEDAPIVESLACNPSAWKSPALKKEHFIFFDNYKKMKIKDLVEMIEEGKIPCDFDEFE